MTDVIQGKARPHRFWFVLLASGVSCVGLWLLFSYRWQPRYTLHLFMDRVNALGENAPVRVDGFDVGRVEQVRFSPRGPDGKPQAGKNFEVLLQIQRRYQDEIRGDSTGTILTDGLLGGSYVEISRGWQGPFLADGDGLAGRVTPTMNLRDLVQRFADAMKCAAEQQKDQSESGEKAGSQGSRH